MILGNTMIWTPSPVPINIANGVSDYTEDFSAVGIDGADGQPIGITLSSGDTMLHICYEYEGIVQYILSTAGDLTSATEDYVFTGGTGNPRSVSFNEDGTKAFICYRQISNGVKEFDLSGAYDLATATASGSALGVLYCEHGYMLPDGSTGYFMDNSNNLKEYSFSPPWVLSGNSLTQTVDLDAIGAVYCSYMTSNGSSLLLGLASYGKINQRDLSTAFDPSTHSFDQELDMSVFSYRNTGGFCFNESFTKVYACIGNDTIEVWDI